MGHLQIYACLILIVWNAHQYQVIKYYYYYYYYYYIIIIIIIDVDVTMT